ncbi:MAG TPA: adenylate kinase [Candidatus Aenigmarchaeota archaeon]|nr:MAG: adenylate kinase [Candidatus Aenigmarchaeota archaeon]HDD45847.1 adenylate kinase [Candidatus Aenigmarchaeota archaeon]
MRVIILAVPGAGKSTILRMISEKVKDVKLVNFGDLMFEEAKKLGISNRDEMRKKLSLDSYRAIQISAAKNIASMEGNVIIDTHASIETPEGFYPGLPIDLVKEMKPDIIVLLEFNPRVIAERRKGDKTRTTRDMEGEEEIALHQAINRVYATIASASTMAKLKIIRLIWEEKREFEHSEYASNEIAKLFSS